MTPSCRAWLEAMAARLAERIARYRRDGIDGAREAVIVACLEDRVAGFRARLVAAGEPPPRIARYDPRLDPRPVAHRIACLRNVLQFCTLFRMEADAERAQADLVALGADPGPPPAQAPVAVTLPAERQAPPPIPVPFAAGPQLEMFA